MNILLLSYSWIFWGCKKSLSHWMLLSFETFGIIPKRNDVMSLHNHHLHKLHVFIICPWFRSSHPEVFLGKDVLKICSAFTGEHSCLSVISIKLICNFIEIKLRHGYSPSNLLYIFGAPFLKNTSGRLLLLIYNFNFL